VPERKPALKNNVTNEDEPAMTAPIEERLDWIKQRFLSEEFELLEISGSFRVSLHKGQNLYVYPETFDNSLSMRIESAEPDHEKRSLDLARLREKLSRILFFARISEFQLSQQLKTKWAYTARVDVAAADDPQPAQDFAVSQDFAASDDAGPCAAASVSERQEVFEQAPASDDGKRLISLDELMELLGMLDLCKLEQMFDWMYIDSSSKLRTAFKELFLSKKDSAGLKTALSLQARKFTTRADMEELELARHINTDIVIQPIIDLLCQTVYKENGMDRPDFNWEKLSR